MAVYTAEKRARTSSRSAYGLEAFEMAVQVVDAVSMFGGKAVASSVIRALEHDALSLALWTRVV